MSKQPLIGSGFYANDDTWEERYSFFDNAWRPNVGPREVVIIDNSDAQNFGLDTPGGTERQIRINGNLGHIANHPNRYRPHLLGWSMSWIIPATIAYSEGRDFIYQEQDCLAFGPWEGALLEQCSANGWAAAFGSAPNHIAPCEQSLFWLRNDFITEFIYMYLALPEGDGKVLPEKKFCLMQQADSRIGTFNFGVGRARPLPLKAPYWYGQKFTPEEMAQLISANLI